MQKRNLLELTSQIKTAFNAACRNCWEKEIYLSKIIVACSGSVSENAKMIMASDIERFMFTHLYF